jgi:hypothetical protein
MTDGAPGSLPTATDEAGHWQAVRRLRREHPRWVVIWLASTSCYRAYPLFRAPRETTLTAVTPEELAVDAQLIPQGCAQVFPQVLAVLLV